MKRIPSLYVGIGVSTYVNPEFKPLPKAIDEVKEVGEVLKALYEVQLIEDPSLADAPAKLMDKLPQEILKKGGNLIIYWSGHGEPASEGKLHLVLKDGKPKQTPLITPEYLAGEAARTGANQVLLIFDTCFAGGGVFPAGKVVDDVHREWPPANPNVWIGILASAMEYEKARDGVFGARLLKLLREGPDPDPGDTSIIHRWSEKKEGVIAEDLIYTLLKEWYPKDQRPKRMVIGPANCELRFPNPKYNPDAPDRVVEHLLLAARGVAPGEEGLYFTGRTAQIAKIVSWLRSSKPGLFVITGPPGSGKSAIAGRIVSLSNPVERSRLVAPGPLEHDDPKEGSVHAHIYARGVTPERLCQLIDEQLVRRGVVQVNPGGLRNKWELFGAIERIQRPLVFVVDGLEEAGEEAWRIAEDAIRLLATKCLVLVGTRELPPRKEGGLSLLQALVPDKTIDLGEAAVQEETRRDVGLYVKRRLSSVSGEIYPAKIVDAIVRIAQEEREGIFLLARVITSQLLIAPVDTSVPGWEGLLDRSIEEAFERELKILPAMRRDKQEIPQAARELLRALAWAYGSGLPDDIWPIVATALSPTETSYQRDDIFWLLGQAGRFVVEGGEGGSAVYRLAHQQLVEHLRPKPIKIDDRAIAEDMAARIAPALIKHYLQFMESGQPPQSHPYLWNYAWRHCSDAGERGIAALRELVNRDSEAFLPDLARSLNNLGIRYSEVGRRQEAVAPAEEAVRIRRELAETNPAFLPDLAGSLNNLGICYSEVGRRQEAVAPTKKAVKIYHKLAETNPAFLPDLAGSLNNLGNSYSEVGKQQEAVAPTEEAVTINRKLAETNPAFLPDLARSLNNLGIRYSAVGRRQEAVAPAEEAFQIRRELAETNPAFLPDLAGSLNNLGICYSEVGRRQEAVAPTEEAVTINRELAETNPAFLPDLAGSLTNLGNSYSAVGRQQEAVAPTEEAVTINRKLAETNPAFLPDLAGSLNNLGIRYSAVGKRQEAVAPTEKAVTFYRELAETNPAFLPDLARSLNNLGNSYSAVGRQQEAVAPTEEAVTINRKLAETNPAFLPDLARSLNNLGIYYSEVGRRQEAVAPTEKAATFYRELAETNPAFLPDLAGSLNNLGISYSEVGRRQEAVAPTEEAVTINRKLAETNPAFLPDLARSLNNLGIYYSEVGRRQEAVAPTEEAVTINRKLAETNPAFLPDLAGSLNNLGISYSAVGREDEVDSVWASVTGSLTLVWAKAFLFIQRAAGRPERDLAAVGDLLAAKALIADKELEALAYHAVCRSRREQDPTTFDDEWQRQSGLCVPEWLVRDRPNTGV